MTKEQAVPVVGVEEAVERLRNIELSDGGGGYCSAVMDVYASEPRKQFYTDLRTILQAIQGSSLRDTHRATEQPVVGDWIEWTGGANPVPGQVVEWRNEHGDTGEWLSDEVAGWAANVPYRIVAYRLSQNQNIQQLSLGGNEGVENAGVNQDLQAQLKAACEALEEVKRHLLGLPAGQNVGVTRAYAVVCQALARRGEG